MSWQDNPEPHVFEPFAANAREFCVCTRAKDDPLHDVKHCPTCHGKGIVPTLPEPIPD